MAKLPRLIETVANSSGIPQPTVSLTARHVREAGMISSGGRGPGGAEMTPTDATNLLIGTVAAMQVKDAPEVVKLFRSAKPIAPGWGDAHADANLSIPRFAELSFGDMLDALFNELAIAEDVRDTTTGEPVDLELEFQRTGHGYSVTPTLTIGRNAAGMRELTNHYIYHANHPAFEGVSEAERKARAQMLFSKGSHGLVVTATVRDLLIFPIADCLAGREIVPEVPL